MLHVVDAEVLQCSHAFQLRDVAPHDPWEDKAFSPDNNSGKQKDISHNNINILASSA